MRVKSAVIAALLLLVMIAFGSVGLVSAHEIQQGDQCTIGTEQTITGNLFIFCRSFILDGRVTGNIIGAATSAVINGTVDGDIYLIAGQMDLGGTVGEDVHFAGPVLKVLPEATLTGDHSDLLTASLSTTLAADSRIPGSVIGVGYQLLLRGTVGEEVSFWGSSLLIDGEVGGDVDAQVGDSNADVSQLETLLYPIPLDISLISPGLRVTDNARVAGQLRYSGPTPGEIAPSAVSSEPIYRPVIVQPDFTPIPPGEQNARTLNLFISQIAREFITLVAIGALGLLIMPRTLQSPIHNLQARPFVCLGVGLLTFIIMFVVALIALLLSLLILFAVSLIQVNELTLTTATLLTVIDIGGIGLIFFVALFVSRVMVALAIGRAIVRAILGDDGSMRKAFMGLAVGVLLLAIVVSLPNFGWIINAIAAFLGLGSIMNLLQARAERAREMTRAPQYVNVSTPALPPRKVAAPEAARPVPPPPPILNDNPPPIGMENLPEGFRFWDD